jgi:hypothetical protein
MKIFNHKNLLLSLIAALTLTCNLAAYNDAATTELHNAIKVGDHNGVIQALVQDANPDAWDSQGKPSLHQTIALALKGNEHSVLIMKRLLTIGAKASPNAVNKSDMAALPYAVTLYAFLAYERKAKKILDLLLEMMNILLANGANPNRIYSTYEQPIVSEGEEEEPFLLDYAIQNDLDEVVALLLAHNAGRKKFDSPNKKRTLQAQLTKHLIEITETIDEDDIQWIEQESARLIPCCKGYSLLFHAAYEKLCSDMERRVLRMKTLTLDDLFEDSMPQQPKPTRRPKRSTKYLLLSAYNEEASDRLCALLSPSAVAQGLCSFENLENELNNNADPNIFNEKGQPVLHEAILRAPLSIIELLLSAGADPNSRDKRGIPALHKAIDLDSAGVEIVALLLKHQADPNACNDNGVYALHKAQQEGLPETVALLLKAGAAQEYSLEAQD